MINFNLCLGNPPPLRRNLWYVSLVLTLVCGPNVPRSLVPFLQMFDWKTDSTCGREH